MAELPDDVGRFIDRTLRSMTDLEILFALLAPGGPASVPELAQGLRISENHATEGLRALRARGLASQGEDGRWSYQPGGPDQQRSVDWLVQHFRTYRVAVTTRIYSHPSDKVTGLAEGFRVRKKKDSDG